MDATTPPARQTVGQLMRPPVARIEPAAHLAAAAYLIKHLRAPAPVVTTDGDHEPVATISDEDVAQGTADGRDPGRTRVWRVVEQQPLTVDSRAAADTARLMLAQGVQHVLVEDGGRLVGVVDLGDLCRAARGACDRRQLRRVRRSRRRWTVASSASRLPRHGFPVSPQDADESVAPGRSRLVTPGKGHHHD